MKKDKETEKNIPEKNRILAKNLKLLIEHNNIKNSEFIEAVGSSKSNVYAWLKGDLYPREETLFKIAYLFNIRVRELKSNHLYLSLTADTYTKPDNFGKFVPSLGEKLNNNRNNFINSVPISVFNSHRTQNSIFMWDNSMNKVFKKGSLLLVEKVDFRAIVPEDYIVFSFLRQSDKHGKYIDLIVRKIKEINYENRTLNCTTESNDPSFANSIQQINFEDTEDIELVILSVNFYSGSVKFDEYGS